MVNIGAGLAKMNRRVLLIDDEFEKSAKSRNMNYNRENNNLIIKYRANLLKGKDAKPLGLRGMPMTARLPFVLMSYVATGDIYLRFYFIFVVRR